MPTSNVLPPRSRAASGFGFRVGPKSTQPHPETSCKAWHMGVFLEVLTKRGPWLNTVPTKGVDIWGASTLSDDRLGYRGLPTPQLVPDWDMTKKS